MTCCIKQDDDNSDTKARKKNLERVKQDALWNLHSKTYIRRYGILALSYTYKVFLRECCPFHKIVLTVEYEDNERLYFVPISSKTAIKDIKLQLLTL